jgi:aminoglycoside phosphotransferase (APT) family kinase protein
MEAYRSRAEWTIAALTSDGILSAGSAAAIRALMDVHAPARVALRYTHGDFCAENLVRRPGGPAIVDNGSVGIQAVDFDLARTWYRWPMRASQRRAFDAGYRTAYATGQSTAAFPFWALLVLTEATLFRARAGADGWRWPLSRLERLLRDRRRRDAAAS